MNSDSDEIVDVQGKTSAIDDTSRLYHSNKYNTIARTILKIYQAYKDYRVSNFSLTLITKKSKTAPVISFPPLMY